ncbi:kinase-like protein, partial [Saitoella complicata NRRL Y-17804]
LRKLGKGAFSDVVLAARLDQEGNFNPNDRARLAAVKIVPFVAAAGANKERIESSVRRELDILRVMRHPNLIRLLGFDICSRNADIVLNYSPGGDLFELASTRRELLSPKFVRRLFAEMVRAVEYLHSKNFVHRDLKLENVLLNLLPDELADIQWPDTFPRPITTLTDLGLSRAIDPNNPLLTTRCGSEDYAAPELLMGQPYDGRQTDAWALGVILYAIIEGRLPFDAVPGMEQKMRGRPSHRIARVEWRWIRLASKDDQKDYEPEWEGAKDIVEGLLRRRDKRWSMKEIAEHDW